MRKKVSLILVSMMMAACLAACGGADSSQGDGFNMTTINGSQGQNTNSVPGAGGGSAAVSSNITATTEATTEVIETEEGDVVVTASVTSDGMIDATDMFTERDLTQNADLTDATEYTLKDGEDITIDSEGVYVISGGASDVTIYVEAGDEDKVQIVLDGATISNESMPCIYVKSADKVFVTTAEGSENNMEVTGTFAADGDTNLDATIFSKDDLVINGQGTLNISSTDNGVACKDTLKITGSTINVSCADAAFEAHDAIEIAAGTINVTSCNDGLHAEDDEDDSVGYIYICGGSLEINANDDAIHATTVFQMDDGNLTLTGAECIEATYVQVNGGAVVINASDDGINAAQKSSQYTPTFEMNDGTVVVTMGAGDTDGVDVNGNIVINGGTLDISGQSTFDYDGTAEYNGGTIIENGTETNTITNQMMGGGMGPGSGFGGGPH